MAATLQEVIDFIMDPNFDPDDRAEIIQALNDQSQMRKAQAKAGLRSGLTVTFRDTRRSRQVSGVIKKVNSVNVDVIETGTGVRWRVSPNLLTVVR